MIQWSIDDAKYWRGQADQAGIRNPQQFPAITPPFGGAARPAIRTKKIGPPSAGII
jgi:hypothetical protein